MLDELLLLLVTSGIARRFLHSQFQKLQGEREREGGRERGRGREREGVREREGGGEGGRERERGGGREREGEGGRAMRQRGVESVAGLMARQGPLHPDFFF